MRIACILMQRNESQALGPWLRYHGYLFGLKNLIVIDHGSNNPAVQDTLRAYEAAGITIIRLPASADYRRKGEFVSEAIAAADATGLYDFLLPLDCDEFVVLRDEANHPTCERAKILDYFVTLKNHRAVFQVAENLINVLGAAGKFWSFPYQKIFFAGGLVGRVDHGSHGENTGLADEIFTTRLAYLHFHHKPHARLVLSSREKLRPYVDVDDIAALQEFRGVGWHLVHNLLRPAAEYTGMMIADAGATEVPGLLPLFAALGIDPLFCEA